MPEDTGGFVVAINSAPRLQGLIPLFKYCHECGAQCGGYLGNAEGVDLREWEGDEAECWGERE